MSIDGNANYFPLTINGLQEISADSQVVSTLQLTSLTPNRVVVSDSSNFLTSGNATSTEIGFLSGTSSNLQTQLNQKASTSYVDMNFLNKTTSSPQSIISALTLEQQAILKEGLKLNSSPTGDWTITVEYIDEYTTNLVFTSSVGSVIKFRGDYGFINSTGWTPATVPIIDSGGNLVTSEITTTELSYLDGVNASIQTQLNYKASTSYVDTNFLNKITATEQNVAAATTFNSTVTANYFFTNNSYNWGRQSASYNAWAIGRIANGTQIRDLQFKDDTAGVTTLLLSNTGQTVYVGLTCDYGTANKVPIWDANKKLVSSGVDSVKITYLDNVSSDIQTQLNGKASTADLALKANLDGGNSFTGLQNYSDKTLNTVAIFDASKNLSSAAISVTELNFIGGLTSSVQTQLNNKANLTGGNTFTGAQTINTGSLNIDTRLLGTPDGVSTGNFWIGLRGTGTEPERLAISIAGPTSTGIVSGVTIPKPLYLTATGLTANRAVYLDGENILKTSAVTATELGYLSGATSGLQGQIDTKASTSYVNTQLSLFLLKTGGTMTGTLTMGGNKVTSTSDPMFPDDLSRKEYVDTKLSLSGGTMTGTINFPNNGKGLNWGAGYSRILDDGHLQICTDDNMYFYIGSTPSTYGTQQMVLTSSGLTMNNTLYANSGVVWNTRGDCSIYPGNQDNYSYNTTNNNLIIKSWWGIAYQSYDGGVRISMNTRDGSAYFEGSVGIGTNPSYKLHVIGDAFATGSLLFGSNGTYTAGCIYSDSNWGCITRAKTSTPALAHFLWTASDDTRLMRISPSGVLNFNGGANPYAVTSGFSTTAGALVIGGIDRNYNDGWNTGLLMECSDTTGITVHDSGLRLASFMYYSGSRFYMGRDPPGTGWGTTPIEIQGDTYLTGTPKVGATTSPEYQLSLDYATGKCIWTPKKYVNIYDTPNVPDYVNWNGLSASNVLYLEVASNILFQGFFTFFTNAVGQRFAYARLQNTTTNTYYYPEATKFFNITGNHEVVPINQFFYNLPAGSYDLYMFGGGNVQVDFNDRAVFSAIVFS